MTTLRYTHLSPAARRGAIDLLNTREEREAEEAVFGDILETTAK